VKAISQEHLEGISSDLAQMSNWTREQTDEMLVVNGHFFLTKHAFGDNSKVSMNILIFNANV